MSWKRAILSGILVLAAGALTGARASDGGYRADLERIANKYGGAEQVPGTSVDYLARFYSMSPAAIRRDLESAAAAATPAPPSPPSPPAPVLAPARAPEPVEPVAEKPDWDDAVAAGAKVFSQKCASCHSATGRGSPAMLGAMGAGLDLRRAEAVQRPPSETLEILSQGRGRMPGYASSLGGDLGKVFAYTLSLQGRRAEDLFASIAPATAGGMGYARPSAALAAAVWARNCASCHGETGGGNHHLAQGLYLDLEALDVTKPASVSLPDQAAFDIVKEGRPPMPPFMMDLSDDEVYASVIHMRTLQGVEAPAPSMATKTAGVSGADGAGIFAAHCSGCHGDQGSGMDGMADAFGVPEDHLDLVRGRAAGWNDGRVAGVILGGAGDDMPAFADTLGDEEVRAILEFLKLQGTTM